MGIDWMRMRPVSDLSPECWAALVEAQATAFRALGNRRAGEFDHLLGGPPPGSGSNRIARHVQVDSGPDCYRRVGSFVYSPVLPAEWRLAAFRSFLPGELADHLRRWRTHLDEVRGGAHRGYLRAWYHYDVTAQYAEAWSLLRERAEQARERTNRWALAPELQAVREEILAIPAPTVPSAPYWAAEHPPVPPDLGDDEPVPITLAKAWNYRVPRKHRVWLPGPWTFEKYVREAVEDPDLHDTLDWMSRAVDDGHGLLLDY
ncbi:hypothetical protein AB0L00_27375 [Actinoallomurus sp. NPDC052308]|uniref:hypothetical protein n=1 Tax=Actinoallomurus sp. NPDC052308 TaxID=3155530 RepID=UPI0034391778